MFFMMGITDGRKNFDFVQTEICDVCGRYGRYEVFMTYMVLSLFFIPCFKWNKRYYVRTSCCGTLYELDPGIGRAIAHGGLVKILPQHLMRVNEGTYHSTKHCNNCGYETDENFEYCPKCGQKF